MDDVVRKLNRIWNISDEDVKGTIKNWKYNEYFVYEGGMNGNMN